MHACAFHVVSDCSCCYRGWAPKRTAHQAPGSPPTESAGHPTIRGRVGNTGPRPSDPFSPAAADLAAASALESAMAERESLVVQAPPDDPPLAGWPHGREGLAGRLPSR